jgi:hypothetical protein
MTDGKDACSQATEAREPATYTVHKREHTRWWEVRDPAGELVCLTVYRRGARG